MERRLGGYDLLLQLGAGGMGAVWLARGAGALVALKTLKDSDGVGADPRVRSMFDKEIRLAARIRHPNVAAVLDAGATADGTPYFVMEWVDGRSVRALVRLAAARGGIPLPIALRIAHDACSGLHAAHELTTESGRPLGLVHRDVSPHNVLVSRDGVTKLIDFGVAKARSDKGGDTSSSGSVKGKVRYMAPEQALARPVDRRADLFALGAVLFEMVTGAAPFEGPNDLAVLRVLVSPRPVVVPSAIPPAVRAVLERALAKKAGDRFASADQMQRAIAAVGELAPRAAVARFIAEKETLDPQRARIAEVLLREKAPPATARAEPAAGPPTRRWIAPAAAGGVALVAVGVGLLAAPVPAAPSPLPSQPVAADPSARPPAAAPPVAAPDPSQPARAAAVPTSARAAAAPRAAHKGAGPARKTAAPARPALAAALPAAEGDEADVASSLRDRR